MNNIDTKNKEQMLQDNKEKVTIIDSGVSTLGKIIVYGHYLKHLLLQYFLGY